MDDRLKLQMEYVRSFKNHAVLPAITDDVWEIIGVCLGDGCLSTYFSRFERRTRYAVLFTGNLKDDLRYYQTYLLPQINRLFGLDLHLKKRYDCNTINLVIASKMVFEFFKSLGVPVGKKVTKIRFTKRILTGNDSVKAAVLRGLLDTDGHIFARKDENYKYPYVAISSGSYKFRIQIKDLISGFGLPAYVHSDSVLVRGSSNLIKWMEVIGTSHNVHRERYNSWLATGRLLPKKFFNRARSLAVECSVRNGKIAGAIPAESNFKLRTESRMPFQQQPSHPTTE